MSKVKKILLIGGGGHCRSIIPIIRRLGYNIKGIIDMPDKKGFLIKGIEIVGSDGDLSNFVDNEIQALVTLGSVVSNEKRMDLYNKAINCGFEMATIVSNRSSVSDGVVVGSGSVVMDGVVINADAKIGNNCIINSGSIIEHDCTIGDHVHIAPGVVMSGTVKVDNLAFIGLGAVIKQGVKIGEEAVIGAGAVVVDDVPVSKLYMGCPAREYKDV